MQNYNSKFKILIPIILLSIFYFLDSTLASAAELSFKKNAEPINLGDTFNVSLILNTEDEVLNAVETEISYSENLKLKGISEGDSIINLWIKKPTLENSKNSSVLLSGLIPGGIKMGAGVILSLTLEPLREGAGYIKIKNAKILRNDSEASEAKVKTANLNFEIQNNRGAVSQGQKLVLDFLPPDEFKIYLSKNKNIFDNSWFISFNAQDKGSGISHYEIREKLLGIFGDWKIGESPYPLFDQRLLSIIEVRAVDNVGRERITTLIPVRLYLAYGILVALLVGFSIFKFVKFIRRIKP